MKIIFILVIFSQTLISFARSERIENEYKLSFPCEKQAEIWNYLKERYSTAQHSIENFQDIYFDTPSLGMFDRQAAVRRRFRVLPNDPSHPRHLRSLVQIKLKRSNEAETNRSEIKFKVKSTLKNLSKDTKPHLIVKDKERYLKTTKELEIDTYALAEALVLNQVRSRVYISQDKTPYATITVDEVTSSKWFFTVNFCEVELELNEIVYTSANDEKRKTMQKFNDILKDDLEKKFDFLKVDQTPKYNKAFNRFVDRIPFFASLLKFSILLK